MKLCFEIYLKGEKTIKRKYLIISVSIAFGESGSNWSIVKTLSLSNFVSFFVNAISQTIALVLIWSVVAVDFANHDVSVLKETKVKIMVL